VCLLSKRGTDLFGQHMVKELRKEEVDTTLVTAWYVLMSLSLSMSMSMSMKGHSLRFVSYAMLCCAMLCYAMLCYAVI
jgi:hypothetical protein